MSREVTLNVLDEKLDNLCSKIDDMNNDVKLNTEFRLTSKGAIAILTITAGFMGGLVMWFLRRVVGE